ncbi:MAG: hypothetical protein R8J94_10760 [Acidimicrobiia bacterium]|nr:hypothetical protein [Acidimicrobiia bacterium]
MSRLPLLLFAVLGVLTGCAEAGPTQAEFDEAMHGVRSDPASYDLTVVNCQNDGEFVDYAWGLTNLSGEPRTFAFDPYLRSLAGEEVPMLRELVGETVEPGEYREWQSFAGGGERFPIGDVECRFEVVDSVLGEFRDEG